MRQFWIGETDINTTGFNVRRIEVEPIPIQDYSDDKGHEDGGVITGQYLRPRTISVSGEISGDPDVARNTLDTLNAFVSGSNLTISTYYGGSRRYWTATPQQFVETDWQGGFKQITIPFKCYDPLGYAEGFTTASLTGQTAIPIAVTPSFVGTYKALPIVTITINSLTVTNPNNISVTIGANTIGITRSYTAGEVVVIDAANRTVTVDGTEVGFSGIWPYLTSDSHAVSYTDGFTARNVDVQVKYKARFK